MNTKLIAIIAAAAFVVGAGAGNASATPSKATTAIVPTCEEDASLTGTGDFSAGRWTAYACTEPTPVPTAEVITRTQTVSSTVEVTPQSCLDAIGYGRDIADWSSGMIDALMPVVQAMSGTITEQTDALVTASDTMSALNAKYDELPANFNAAAAACESH